MSAFEGKADMTSCVSAFDPKRTFTRFAVFSATKLKMTCINRRDGGYFTHSLRGTSGRSGQLIAPEKKSDNRPR